MEPDGTKGFFCQSKGRKTPWPEQAGNDLMVQGQLEPWCKSGPAVLNHSVLHCFSKPPVTNPLHSTDSHCLEHQEDSSGCEQRAGAGAATTHLPPTWFHPHNHPGNPKKSAQPELTSRKKPQILCLQSTKMPQVSATPSCCCKSSFPGLSCIL